MLLWFRNDLRVHDNPALLYYLEHTQAGSGEPTAIFFITKKQWLVHQLSAIKIDLILRHVQWLSGQLDKLGISLRVVDCADFAAQIEYLEHYSQQNPSHQVVVNEELEFNERQRDQQLISRGVNLVAFESDVIVPKGKILNKQHAMYKVFTPFKKAWLSVVQDYGFDYISKQALSSFRVDDSSHSAKASITIEHDGCSSSWPLVDEIEQTIIPEFLNDKLAEYAQQRDIPGCKGTSGLSPYLAIGALSARYLLRQLQQQHPDILSARDSDVFVWLNELIWREFYRHLLYHFPRLAKGSNFNRKYDALVWLNNQQHFSAWCEGKTGYPIVDAAMAQLNQTGWMHNRLRMIVASFLTKHLLIDWRWGESYFSTHLIDGDLAANNGGWQWAASTGCDAQPYFRIFNPIRQSERFDPNGLFIRKYLPELADVPDKAIHFPHLYLAREKITGYWPAIVDHKAARARALTCYKQV
jgi:deoxyribodipyrimidine photo-lyase